MENLSISKPFSIVIKFGLQFHSCRAYKSLNQFVSQNSTYYKELIDIFYSKLKMFYLCEVYKMIYSQPSRLVL